MGDQSRSGIKDKPLSLKVKSREASIERQSTARDDKLAGMRRVNEDFCSAKAQVEHTLASNVQLDTSLSNLLKKQVLKLVDSEKALSSVKKRVEHLKELQSKDTVPKGLKIRPIKAKGKAGDLQKEFDEIIRDAERKLLDKTINSLLKDIPTFENSLEECRSDINNTIKKWRLSFPHKDDKYAEKANAIAELAQRFVENFYFECTAIETSKALVKTLNKDEKSKQHSQSEMEAEFQVTEQSIKDMVKNEVQRLNGSASKDANPTNRQSRNRNRQNQHNNQRRVRYQSNRPKGRQRSKSSSQRQQQQQGASKPKNGRGRGSGHGT